MTLGFTPSQLKTAQKLIANPEWRMNNLYKVINKSGEAVTFKMNWAQEDLYKNVWYMNVVLKARQLGMCLDPDTKVLKSDFTWVRIADINVGDELVGVDEYPRCGGSARKLRKTIVEGVMSKTSPRYRITFDNGKTLICTGNHRWLTRRASTEYNWRSIEGKGEHKLNVGYKIRRISTDTWETGGYEDGWIGGMLDGEGSLALKTRLGGSINISQLAGKVFDRIEDYFKSRNYNYRIEIDKNQRKSKFGCQPVNKVVLSISSEIIKLIGVTRPSRFLERDWWEGKKIPLVLDGNYSTIKSIDLISDGFVIDLQTSTKTFIAEGYVSHNSTMIAILFLDRCFWNENMHAGIIAHTREDSEMLFRKIKFAYDSMPEIFKQYRSVETDTIRELKFNNGSSLRVGTSMRSSTLNYLHISEFGYICAHYPDKAKEIMAGSLNTVATGQYVFIESTAEGSGSFFYDICQNSIKAEREKLKLTELDFKFHFYPWWKEPTYKLGEAMEHPKELKEYFSKLESKNILLSGAQESWYIKKWQTLGDAIFAEYPSTPEEAFQASASGLFYGKLLTDARLSKRIGHVPYDDNTLVHTSWDIGFGVSGYNAIWFFQICGNEIHLIDFYQDHGRSMAEYIQYVKSKPYIYGDHIAPHDIKVHEYTHGYSRWEVARKLGIEFTVAPKLSIIEGIDAVKSCLPRMWFDEEKCGEGVRMLENYRKQWDERLAKWSEKAVNDISCHASDSLRMMAISLANLEGHRGSVENDLKAVSRYFGH